MFEKSLQDLIKGIRNHKQDSGAYLARALAEVRRELQSNDRTVKFVAVQKATYLQMIGVDVSFAAFNIVEVMSSSRFAHRRAGMLAAAQIFDPSADVILLTTNWFVKELHDQNMYVVGNAMNCLSNIATRELARDTLEHVASQLTSTRPFLRKKAALTLYKLYLKYPQGLPQTFDRLRQRLDDSDMAVVSCTVNVICELSRKNPRNFLALAPQLFQLLTTSSNNWMLIKIVKLMAALLPEEPRLARKILDPLAKIVETTQAKSLLYECVHTITQALPYTARVDGSQPKNVPEIVALSTKKLREFVEDPDQNLKYLGLVGLVNLMRSHPRVVAEHKGMVLQCLLDDDVTVRLRALELLTGMVTKRNLMDIVGKMLQHVHSADGNYRDELIEKIIFVCSRDKYAFLGNFSWYISVLVDLAHIYGAPKGKEIASQLIDIAVRVPDVRKFATVSMRNLILEERLLQRTNAHSIQDGPSYVLFAASWIVSEYADLLDPMGVESLTESFESLCATMLSERTLSLAPFVQAAFVHNALKLVKSSAKFEAQNGSEGDRRLRRFGDAVRVSLAEFAKSDHIHVQDEAVTSLAILREIKLIEGKPEKDGHEEQDLLSLEIPVSRSDSGISKSNFAEDVASALSSLFKDELFPVAPKAQNKVPPPEGFDIAKPLNLKAKGFSASAWDEDRISEPSRSEGSILRVSFRDNTFEAENAASEDHEDEVALMPGMDEHASNRKKDKKKTKRPKKTISSPSHSDPFYLQAKVHRESTEQHGFDSELTTGPVFVESLQERFGGVTINDIMMQSAQPAEAMTVVMDDVMPAGARDSDDEAGPERRVLNDEDLTLESIDLRKQEDASEDKRKATKKKNHKISTEEEIKSTKKRKKKTKQKGEKAKN